MAFVGFVSIFGYQLLRLFGLAFEIDYGRWLFSDEEKHALSVKHITSPILFDNLKKPIPGGLYDPALGPIDQKRGCLTCRQPGVHCTGHFGHIDLMLPVYNPLVFKELVKILRMICIFCHQFKMHQDRVNIFDSKLELIAEGRMVEAARVKLSKDDEEGPGINLSDDDVDTVLDKTVVTRSGNRRTLWTSTQLAAARQVIARFKDDMPRNCSRSKINCSNKVSKLRSRMSPR